MKFKKFAYHHILPNFAWFGIHCLSASLRITTVGEKQIHLLQSKGHRLVFALWHGRQFLFVRHMSKRNIGIMSSTSRDGRLQADILKKFGYVIIYGSSAKSPVRAMVGTIRKMRAGHDIAITVDGPTGPLYKVKPGALFLAKKMDALIIPMTFSAAPGIILSSWDEYLLPKPFAHAAIYFGEAFRPSQNTADAIIQEECLLLEKTLNQITQKADLLVKQ